MIFKKISQNATIEKNFDSMIKNISLKCNFTIHKKIQLIMHKYSKNMSI